MNHTAKFKVTLEFEVDINPIAVPDADTLEKMSPGKGAGKKKQFTEKDLRAGMKAKGMSDADIDKALAGGKKGGGKGVGKGQPNYQMLIYPEYETWAAAQQELQQEILKDDRLSTEYVREIVRDLTRGHIDALIDEKYGAPDLNGVLMAAMQRISTADQAKLHAEEESLLHDETELVDNSVEFQFAGLTVTRV